MKTSVEIDEKKAALAKKLGGANTLRQLIDEALDAYIQRARRGAMADLLGTDFFEGNLDRSRERARGRSRR